MTEVTVLLSADTHTARCIVDIGQHQNKRESRLEYPEHVMVIIVIYFIIIGF